MAGINNPQGSYSYKLEMDGLGAGRFSEVSGLENSVMPNEYHQGDMLQNVYKISGMKLYNNITLKKRAC